MLAPSAMRCFWRLRARNPHDPNAPETPGRRCPHVGHVSTGWHKFRGLPPVYGFRASQAPLSDSSSMSLVPGLGRPIGPWHASVKLSVLGGITCDESLFPYLRLASFPAALPALPP